MAIQLSTEHLAMVKRILQQFLPQHTALVFGSRATGSAMQYSDLDVLIQGEPINVATMAAVKQAFSDSDLPIFVDLVQQQDMSEAFYNTIQHDLLEI